MCFVFFFQKKGTYMDGYIFNCSSPRNNTRLCLSKYRALIVLTLHTQEVKQSHIKPVSQKWQKIAEK